MAAMTLDPVIAGLERGPVGATGGESALDERPAQVTVAVPRFARPTLAGAFVLAGTHGAPTAQMAGSGKPAHVATRFHEDRDGALAVNPGNRIQVGQRRLERGDQSVDLL